MGNGLTKGEEFPEKKKNSYNGRDPKISNQQLEDLGVMDKVRELASQIMHTHKKEANKTWIVVEWEYSHSTHGYLENKTAKKLMCIETGEYKNI